MGKRIAAIIVTVLAIRGIIFVVFPATAFGLSEYLPLALGAVIGVLMWELWHMRDEHWLI